MSAAFVPLFWKGREMKVLLTSGLRREIRCILSRKGKGGRVVKFKKIWEGECRKLRMILERSRNQIFRGG